MLLQGHHCKMIMADVCSIKATLIAMKEFEDFEDFAILSFYNNIHYYSESLTHEDMYL